MYMRSTRNRRKSGWLSILAVRVGLRLGMRMRGFTAKAAARSGIIDSAWG